MLCEDFPSAIKRRYLPSVFCYATKEAELEYPDYRTVMTKVWPEVISHSPVKFRLVFPPADVDLTEFKTSLLLARSQEQTYSRKELNTTTMIRNFFLERNFMPLQFFPDIPSGVLVIMKSDENVKQIPECVPQWLSQEVTRMKKGCIRFPAENLVQRVTKWVINSVIANYRAAKAKVERDYEENCVSFRQTIQSLFVQKEEKDKYRYAGITSRKNHADLMIQLGKYDEAKTSYRKLIDSTPELPEFTAEVNLCVSFSDILCNSVKQRTLEQIVAARRNKKNQEHNIVCCLTELYIRLAIRAEPWKAPDPFREQDPLEVIAVPFFHEQIGLCAPTRHASHRFWYSAQWYDKIGAVEHALGCYRSAIDNLHVNIWPHVLQKINYRMLDGMKRVADDPTEIFVDIINSNILTDPDKLESLLGHFKMTGPFPCRFVKCQVIGCHAQGFPWTQIRGLELDWNQIGERLFGAFYRGSFFDYKHLTKRVCGVSEHVFMRLALHMPTCGRDLMNLSLLIRGTAGAEVSNVCVAAASDAFVELVLTPTSPGDIEIYGISFLWGENGVRFECSFTHSPLKLHVCDNIPKLEMRVDSALDSVMCVGKITKIGVTLRNVSNVPLKKLGLYFTEYMDTRLIEPQVEDVCGQYRLDALAPGDEMHLIVAVHATRVGRSVLNMIFPYWGENPPPRYESLQVEYEVLPKHELALSGTESVRIEAWAPRMCHALGFTGPYDDIDKHLVEVDERIAIIDFVSKENTTEKTVVYDYVKPFVNYDSLTFWYEDTSGVVGVPVANPRTAISVLLRIINNCLEIEITNRYGVDITELLIAIGNDAKRGFVVTGKTTHFIESIGVSDKVIVSMNIATLSSKLTIPLYVECAFFRCTYDIEYRL